MLSATLRIVEGLSPCRPGEIATLRWAGRLLKKPGGSEGNRGVPPPLAPNLEAFRLASDTCTMEES